MHSAVKTCELSGETWQFMGSPGDACQQRFTGDTPEDDTNSSFYFDSFKNLCRGQVRSDSQLGKAHLILNFALVDISMKQLDDTVFV